MSFVSEGGGWVDPNFEPPYIAPPPKPPTDTAKGMTGGNAGSTIYTSAWNRYERQQERRLQAEREARQRAADESARVATGNLNRAVDSGLSEAYLANERNKVSAQNMGAVSGYGGASETSLMGQQANYMNNRGKLEDRRAEELGGIEARRMQGSMAAEQDYQSKLYQFAMQRYDAERQAQLQNAKAAQGSKSAQRRGYYDPLYYEDWKEE